MVHQERRAARARARSRAGQVGPQLPDRASADERRADVIALVTLLAASLWQVANPPPILSALHAQDPALANACVEFAPTLTRMLTTFIHGCANELQ
jgi:hypothetical protein